MPRESNTTTFNRRGWQHVYKQYGEAYEWFIKTDDDTFLWMSHLMGYLDTLNHTEKYFIGAEITSSSKLKWVGGGAGYVFSRATLQEVVSGT